MTRLFNLASKHRLLLCSIYLPAFVTATAQNTMLVLMPLYVLHLGYDASIAALVFAARGLGTLAGDIPGGKLIERLGDKRTMLIGVALSGASYLFMGVSSSPWILAALCFCTGFSGSCSLLGRQSFLAERFRPDQRGRIIGLLGGVVRGGSFVGPLLGGILVVTFSFNFVFISLTFLCLGAFALVSVFTEPSVVPTRNTSTHTHPFKIVAEHRVIFLTAGMATIGLQFMRTVRTLLLPLIGASLGLEADAIGLIVAVGAIVDILMVYPTGIIMDKYGRKASSGPAFLLFSLALGSLSLVDSPATLLVAAMCMGLANGLTAGLVLVLGADYAPDHNRGPFLGTWRLVSDIGSASSPAGISLILKIASLSITGAIAGVIGLAATAVLVFTVSEPLKKRRQGEQDQTSGDG